MLPLVVLLAVVSPVTPTTEVARLQAHFAIVDRELRAADTHGMSTAQRARRAALIADLSGYRARGVFPRNLALAHQTPVFIDDRGVRCAMAYLIERHGGPALVARVAATANNAYVRELAGDPELQAWLDRNGLTAAEAARIQPAYPQMAGQRCGVASPCTEGTCEPAIDEPALAFCSPACDPAAPTCPIGIEGIAMECQPRGDRYLCAYPTPSPGTTGWACDPSSVTANVCIGGCVPAGDGAICTPSCSNSQPCPDGFACEPLADGAGADYLRSCEPIANGGCGTTSAPAGLIGLLIALLPLARRRRGTVFGA